MEFKWSNFCDDVNQNSSFSFFTSKSFLFDTSKTIQQTWDNYFNCIILQQLAQSD